MDKHIVIETPARTVLIKGAPTMQPAQLAISPVRAMSVAVQREGIPGAKGEKGDPGSGLITKIAGEAVSGGKAVIIGDDDQVYIFDILNESHYGRLCGIAKQAAVPGTQLQVYTAGEAVEEGSGWQAGQTYYIGANGILTTIAPVAGIVKMIGVGSAQDSILISNGFEIITL